MAAPLGPDSLPHFEDRVLYHVVELAGDLPLLAGFGVDDESIAARLTEDPAFPPGALATAIAGGIFYSTAERGPSWRRRARRLWRSRSACPKPGAA